MGGKIFRAISLLCIIVTLTVGGFAAMVVASGRLTPENLDVLAKMLRGEPVLAEQDETQAEAATQPASSAEEQIDRQEELTERRSLLLQRRMEELASQQRQAAQLLARIEAARAQLREEALALAARIEQFDQQAEDEDFQAQLRVYEAMQPGDLKTIFMGMQTEEAAAYLRAMQPRDAGRVLGQFRTPGEQQFRQQLLDAMERAG